MSINDREYWSGNTKWTILRKWQRRSHKTKNKNQTKKPQKKPTVCVVHHYPQANTNNVNKTWTLLQTSFFLKPQNRFESNLAEMFIGWSYTRFVLLVLIGNPTWLPGPIMCSDWSKFKKIFLLETTKPIELWLCRNDHWVVLY